ncbi:Fic family protein [Maritalea porphyrae]|uniref:Fic family protein n=1 Tax=Maritalea porphyrae TaxID=880732 RepID=UPI0022AEF014|nr:Fic family protein [Maritalea porphyrae]MCZ4274164.1 Fic family protein [Maritalea porphyrae]
MKWNWQRTNWPHFAYDSEAIKTLETEFLQQSGIAIGAFKHIRQDEKAELIVELISTEALKTSEIEGEYFNRESVQASIRRNFGLEDKNLKATAAEQGIAQMMNALYEDFREPLSHDMIFEWHKMITAGRHDLIDIGRYRTHEEPMQIVSGPDYARKVHFEAPPSAQIHAQMDQFITWFNKNTTLPALTCASIAHLYFECIHPFEDGNGRIGRAIAEKSLSQNLGQPTLLALSNSINTAKKAYYSNLEKSNKDLELTSWIKYFGETILTAQQYSLRLIEFLIAKTKLFDQLRGQLNPRQEKAMIRIFREGPDGFKGGLSAENYVSITGATRPTTTRDLADLVQKKALTKTGTRRHTRYWLKLD